MEPIEFYKPLEKDFESFCDVFFENDDVILKYCKEKSIIYRYL